MGWTEPWQNALSQIEHLVRMGRSVVGRTRSSDPIDQPVRRLDRALEALESTAPPGPPRPTLLEQLAERKPSFKRSTLPMLIELVRRAREAPSVEGDLGDEIPEDQWAERLLAFAEVRSSALHSRARTKWGGPPEVQIGLLALAGLMLRTFYATDDVRFLNAAHKILDVGDLTRLKRRWNPGSELGGVFDVFRGAAAAGLERVEEW